MTLTHELVALGRAFHPRRGQVGDRIEYALWALMVLWLLVGSLRAWGGLHLNAGASDLWNGLLFIIIYLLGRAHERENEAD